MLESNFNGVQHIGIPVTDMDRSKEFYGKLGFEIAMIKPFDHNNGKGTCCMMKRQNTIMELYLLPMEELEGIRNRQNGHIDHITFDVNDIEKAYKEIKDAGFTIDEDAPMFLDFWEKGIKYFNVIGPDKERLEFCQILK